MQDQYSRTQLLLGAEAMEKLHHARVAVFGIGGVGGYTVEALARSGVGALDLIDDDKVCLTNLNRQIIATRSTVGQYKVDVAEQRIHDIDPNIKVTTHRCFFGPETQDDFDFTQYDYVVDAIDTVTGKLALVMKCKEAGTPIICSMGAGNKMDPTRFEVTDIYKTSVCPLAKVMRTECRKRKIKHLKAQVHCTAHRAGLQRLCALGGRSDHRRRGRQRPCGLCTAEGVKPTAASLRRGTIWNALRVALRINQGKNIYNFGIPERLRTLRYSIFTGGIVEKNGICTAPLSTKARRCGKDCILSLRPFP